MKYILEIDFETKKHCLLCPVRDEETDDCKMQYCKEFTNWEEQMTDCPLKLVEVEETVTDKQINPCQTCYFDWKDYCTPEKQSECKEVKQNGQT
jgi:hypothetical protein